MAKKMTTEDAINRIKEMYGDEYTLISNYTLSTEPITVRHNPCGTEFTIKRAKSFLQKEQSVSCPKCYKKESKSYKGISESEFAKLVNEMTDGEYEYISGFKNVSTKVNILHKKCGTTLFMQPKLFLPPKSRRCAKCTNKEIRGKYAIKKNYLQMLLDEKSYGDEYEWLSPYTNNNKDKLLMVHKTCGYVYRVRPNDFQQGYKCPYCSNTVSYGEIELAEYIKSLGFNIETRKRFKINDDHSYEADVYIPDLHIGFEFNGYYWHSDKMKDKNYHYLKKEVFLQNGIQIYFINEIDWNNKKEIWKSKIKHILKVSDCEKIFARKCEIKFNIAASEKRQFLNTNHLQGYVNDSFSFGLYSNNKLVALMTFSSNRKNVNNNKQRIELLRYATDINYNIPGGFSRLLKHAKEYIAENYSDQCIDNKYIYTFASRDISNGNLYEKNGFELMYTTKPSYNYVYKNKIVNRYTFRKSNLSKLFPEYYNESLTEFEITDSIKGIFRIWNSGNYVYRCKI